MYKVGRILWMVLEQKRPVALCFDEPTLLGRSRLDFFFCWPIE